MSVTRRLFLGEIPDSAVGAQHHGHHHLHQGHVPAKPAPAAPSTHAAVDNRRISPAAYDTFIRELHAGMEKMMQDMHADPPSGNPDIDFLAMMIPHHWGAVEMSRLVLRDGRDPLVREIAEKILSVQITEIEAMRGRLAALKRGDEDYPSLTGNRGP